jgi:hypothetical protein
MGTTPSVNANNTEEFKPLSYAQFAQTLHDAIQGADTRGPGRRIAEEYLRTLRMEFR